MAWGFCVALLEFAWLNSALGPTTFCSLRFHLGMNRKNQEEHQSISKSMPDLDKAAVFSWLGVANLAHCRVIDGELILEGLGNSRGRNIGVVGYEVGIVVGNRGGRKGVRGRGVGVLCLSGLCFLLPCPMHFPCIPSPLNGSHIHHLSIRPQQQQQQHRIFTSASHPRIHLEKASGRASRLIPPSRHLLKETNKSRWDPLNSCCYSFPTCMSSRIRQMYARCLGTCSFFLFSGTDEIKSISHTLSFVLIVLASCRVSLYHIVPSP